MGVLWLVKLPNDNISLLASISGGGFNDRAEI